MKTSSSLLLTLLIIMTSESVEGVKVDPPSPLGAVWNHVSLLMEAVKQKDADVIVQLFDTKEVDHVNMDRFIEVFQGKHIHVDTANLQEDGTTVIAEIKIGENHPATLTLIKTKSSMTGLRITGIAAEGNECSAEQGLLGCAVKIVE